MLLPIVLLLASAGPIQHADKAAASMEPSATSSQPQTLLPDPGSKKFVLGPRGNLKMPDQRIIIPNNPGPNRFVIERRSNREMLFDEGIIHHPGPTNVGCMSITAYVFSDGENPQLQYVTHCPNLDVPNQTERARHRLPETEQPPDLKRTNY